MKRAIIAATSLLLVTACGSERSGTYETEDGEKVEYSVDNRGSNATATVTNDDGTSTVRTGNNVAIDLPAGFTLYPGSKVVTNTVFNRDDGKGAMVIFQSDAKPDEVLAYYRKEAEAAGVKIEMEMKTAQGTMLAGKGDGDVIFSINASEQDGGTTAQMTVGKGLE